LYDQKGKFILHLINLTNQNTWRQPLDELITVGPLFISIKKKQAVKGEIHSLVSNKKLLARVSEDVISFEITSILDHEVIVIS
jgi:hypothetical protein